MNTLTKIAVGVDVSKKQLDVAFYPAIEKGFAVTNDVKGIESLLKKLSKYQVTQVVCESSGCETLLLQMLVKHNHSAWRVEPSRIKAFIRSEGVHVKTDKSDACMMALFASQKQRGHDAIPLTEGGLQLEALTKRRDDLKMMIQAEKSRFLQSYEMICKNDLKAHIDFLEKRVECLDKQIIDLIEQNSTWKQKVAIVESMPGVGAVSSMKLIAQLPELGLISDKKIASLVGVAPFIRQSGTWRGKAFTYAGRRSVRNVLYMAALSAARNNPVLKIFYNKLIDAGKKPKVALIAVLRKMLVILNAMVRKAENWSASVAEKGQSRMKPA
jgi:transposase